MDTTNIAIPKKEIAPGVFSTGGTATIPSNSPAANVISPESLKPVPTTNVPTFKPEIPSVEGDVAYYNQLLNQQTDNQKQLEIVRNQGLGEVSKLVQELTGQGNEQLALEQQFVNPAQQQLQGLTGQIGTQLAEYRGLATAYDKQSADIEAGAGRKGLTTGAVMGQQGAIERAKSARLNEKASEISLLQAEAQAVQGKVELAQKQVDRAIDLKYQSKQQEIEARKFQLASISDMLTKEEKRQADAINMSLKKEEDRIGRLSEFQKTALNNAIANGAPSTVLDKISRAQSIDQITKLGSSYLVNPKDALELTKLRVDINRSSAEYAKTIQELNAARETIGGTTGDVTGDLIMGSSQYQGKQPSSGWIDDFTQAQVALGNVKELQALVQKEGQTGPVSGAVKGFLGKLDSNFANAAAINAQIQRTVPGLARGIFKEVGVLTDQDIANYKKTLPNLASPEDQNKLALLATYDVIERSLALSLANQAKAKNDVSGYYQDYIDAKNNVAQLKKELGFVEAAPISKENNAKLEGMWGNVTKAVDSTGVLDSFLK